MKCWICKQLTTKFFFFNKNILVCLLYFYAFTCKNKQTKNSTWVSVASACHSRFDMLLLCPLAILSYIPASCLINKIKHKSNAFWSGDFRYLFDLVFSWLCILKDYAWSALNALRCSKCLWKMWLEKNNYIFLQNKAETDPVSTIWNKKNESISDDFLFRKCIFKRL